MDTIRSLEHEAEASFDIAFSTKQPFASLMAAMHQTWRSWKAYRALRVAKAEVMGLGDHALKDIGLDRSEIDSVLTDRNGERRNAAPQPPVLQEP